MVRAVACKVKGRRFVSSSYEMVFLLSPQEIRKIRSGQNKLDDLG